ncbi:hypothetical protein F5Y09DRAFT_345092 [Xylaria sp. FL1042]|nr:hypothetical protein F5Y09DRAFT_345092 [Xylaria sp. FL1042]
MSGHTAFPLEDQHIGRNQPQCSPTSQHSEGLDIPQTTSSVDDSSISMSTNKWPIVQEKPVHSLPEGLESTPNLGLKASLGTYGLVIIGGGAIIIFASVAFLAFLWFGAGSAPEAQGAPHFWRYIALNGWIDRIITFVALILRTTVTAQAAVCVSMLAGLILERSFVLRSKVAHFSILRATNTGPTTLMHLILSSRNMRMIFKIESLLGLLLLFNTTGLQFSSTILLSDVHESNVAGEKGPVEVHDSYSTNQQKITLSEHFYKTMRPIYAIYGESTSNFTRISGTNGLSDTGIIERVFLPIGDPDKRMAVRSYDGDATAFSLRTACIRPDIRDLEFGVYSWAEHKGDNFGRISATLDYGQSIKKTGVGGVCGSKDCPAIPFSCWLSEAFDGFGWQSTFCFVGGVGGTLWPAEEGPGSTSIDHPWSVNSSIYLVFSNNMGTVDWDTADKLGTLHNGSLVASTASDYNEWRTYRLMPGRFLNVSLCFQSYNLGLSSVGMAATGAVVEPTIRYDLDTGGINTDAVQSYFGTVPTRQQPSQRGILQIDKIQRQPLRSQNESQNYTITNLARRFTKSS